MITLKMPIIDQQFCDKNGANCVRKTFCAEYVMDANRQWVFSKNHDIKFCHGIFGINSQELVNVKAFGRDVELWVKDTLSKLNRCQSPNEQP